MAPLVREKITVSKGRRGGAVLWSLVLYGLVELASDLSVRDIYTHRQASGPINHNGVQLNSLHFCVQDGRQQRQEYCSINCHDEASKLDYNVGVASSKIHCEQHHQQQPQQLLPQTAQQEQNQNLCSSKKSTISSTTTTTTTTTTATATATATATTTAKSDANYQASPEAKTRPLLSSSGGGVADYLSSLLGDFLAGSPSSSGRASFFGSKILMAHASALYHPKQNKEIIILNSTNFFPELVQYKHPFRHIKLVEYYVSFCGFCIKFKPTFAALSKEIYAWRNVIRSAVIDYGVTSNSPISHSWPIEVVPALRIHPPPKRSSAEMLHEQFAAWSSAPMMASSSLQAKAYQAYSASDVQVQPMNITQVLDNVELIKAQLFVYLDRYVRDKPEMAVPRNWPNLKPVSEASLASLMQKHPRQELFLLLESSSGDPSAAFRVLMELSSTGARQAVRYVRSSENRALVEDVIANLNRSSGGAAEELARLLDPSQSSSSSSSSIYLVHVDGTHAGHSSKLPLATLITGAELLAVETFSPPETSQRARRHLTTSGQSLSPSPSQSSSTSVAADGDDDKNLDHHHHEQQQQRQRPRFRRATGDNSGELFDKLSEQRQVNLLAKYIHQQYTETGEDREFVRALDNFDDSLRQDEPPVSSDLTPDRYVRSEEDDQGSSSKLSEDNSLFGRLKKAISLSQEATPAAGVESTVIAIKALPSASFPEPGDYVDKLKAIRYILFSEIPRRLSARNLANETHAHRLSRVAELGELVSVIKAYFPWADSRSVAFVEGVHGYLLRQERLMSVNSSLRLDGASFKAELRRLERREGAGLPEVKEWSHCKWGGYPCALWRLFHTLAVFEFEKVRQVRQPPQAAISPALPDLGATASQPKKSLELGQTPVLPTITTQTSTITGGGRLPVEHLVSQGITTTSSSMALTIASSQSSVSSDSSAAAANSTKPPSELELPPPVLLVMRDYVTNYFSCDECARHFRQETADLSLARIRHQESAEFSVIWLWTTHNRVNKRLSVSPDSNPPDHPKVWFPTYSQCPKCYRRPPSFLAEPAGPQDPSIFRESVEWEERAVLEHLLAEYLRHPLSSSSHPMCRLWGQPAGYLLALALLVWLLISALRFAGCYIERQRRHKANLLNGVSTGYSVELQ